MIGTYLWSAATGTPIEVWGDGSVVRDFIYVRDLADLCASALTSDVSGVFNAGQGAGASILDILGMIEKTVGKPLDPVFKPGRNFDVPRVVLDTSRARRAFDWGPKFELEQGIDLAWTWVQEQM